jgi:cell division protein FtsL
MSLQDDKQDLAKLRKLVAEQQQELDALRQKVEQFNWKSDGALRTIAKMHGLKRSPKGGKV